MSVDRRELPGPAPHYPDGPGRAVVGGHAARAARGRNAHDPPAAVIAGPVRVGVLLVGSMQERWVLDALREGLAVPGVELAAVAVAAASTRDTVAASLHRFLDRMDTWLRCRHEALFAPVDVAAELGGPPLSNVTLVHHDGQGWSPDDAGIAALRRSPVDVWLCFAATPPRRPLRQLSRFGVWGLEIGLNVPATSLWAGAAEVGSRIPVTVTSVVDYSVHDAVPVQRAVGATIGNSARRNRLMSLRRASSAFARALAALTRDDHRSLPGTTLPLPADYPVLREPTTGGVLRLGRRLVTSVAANRWHALRSREQWQIAYQFADGPRVDFGRLRYLVPPKDRFWADPFAVEHYGRYFIFFEELRYGTQRGRIMAVEVHDDREPGEARVVLERPYHLSYPFVFRWQGSLYMVPETAENGTVEIYRCESFPLQWRLRQVLLDRISAYDATLWRDKDRWWMFVGVAPFGTDELHLYTSNAPLGPWTPHRRNPVVSDARCARPAGPLFSRDGVLYRPSQDCSVAYGHAVSINRVDVLDDDDYRETPVQRIEPGWRRDIIRVHTLGGSRRLRVIDYLVRRRRW